MSGAADLLAALIGAASGVVDISGGFSSEDTAAGAAFASVKFEADGDVIALSSGGSVDSGDWVTPKSVAPGAYEIMFHQDSGDAVDAGDALDTWHALTSDRSVSLTQTGVGSKAAGLTASIRLGGVVLSSGSITLSAEAI